MMGGVERAVKGVGDWLGKGATDLYHASDDLLGKVFDYKGYSTRKKEFFENEANQRQTTQNNLIKHRNAIADRNGKRNQYMVDSLGGQIASRSNLGSGKQDFSGQPINYTGNVSGLSKRDPLFKFNNQ
jgi:hypothetical protein